MTRRRMWLALAALSLGGCLCAGDRFTETGYAEMASHGPEIAACVGLHDCAALCAGVFQLDDSVEIERCVITSLVRQDFTTLIAPISTATDVRSIRAANVEVSYAEQVPCDYDSDDDGWDDGWDDDGSTDDSSDDDGWDDGGWDDGSDDDGSTDDGSDDDGSTDDGSDDDWGELRAPTPASDAGRAAIIRSVAPAHQLRHHRVDKR